MVQERHIEDFAAVVAHGREKAVVYRRLEYNLLSGLGKGLYGRGESGNDAGSVDDPVFFDFPAVATGEPAADSFIITVRHADISEHSVLHPLAEDIDDEWGGLEVHVGYP